MRVHGTILAWRTKRALLREVRSLSIKPTSYALGRMVKRHVSWDQVLWVQKHGEVVDYTVTETRRVLLRVQPRGEVCIVIDLDTADLVTVFRNDAGDQHNTLDTSRYLFGHVDTTWPLTTEIRNGTFTRSGSYVPVLCACGNVATGICIRRGEPVCADCEDGNGS